MVTHPIVVDNVSKVFRIRTTASGHGLERVSRYLFRKKKVTALDGVSLKVKKNEIFGLIGPNGAGKTTLTKIISTLLLPTTGTVLVNGYDVQENLDRVQESLGVVLGEKARALYWRLSGQKNLEFYSTLYEIPKQQALKRIKELLRIVDLTDVKDEYVMHYSTGMKNRLGIARALLSDPEILLFDEITAGLDPSSALTIRNLIKKLSSHEDKTIFLTSHNMEEIEYLCDKVAMLYQGKIIAMGTPDELKRKFEKDVIVKAHLTAHIPNLDDKIEKLSKVIHARQDINRVVVHAKQGTDVADIVSVIDKEGGKIQDITTLKPTMEDVFLRMVKQRQRAAK